jgi:RsmE family RNA methyltransferase
MRPLDPEAPPVNLLLLEPGERGPDGRVRLSGRRHQHALEILGVAPGDSLAVGEIGGRIGTGRVLGIDAEGLELEVSLHSEPPAPLPVALALALPRPPTLRKVLQQATALGVKQLGLFGSARVEKSFWQSRALEPAAIGEQLRLGLEQARDTRLPRVECVPGFRSFCEQLLPRLAAGGPVWLAEAAAPPPPEGVPALLVLGPEGGLLPSEIRAIEAAGAVRIGLGNRALRVETAAVELLGIAANRLSYTRPPSWT